MNFERNAGAADALAIVALGFCGVGARAEFSTTQPSGCQGVQINCVDDGGMAGSGCVTGGQRTGSNCADGGSMGGVDCCSGTVVNCADGNMGAADCCGQGGMVNCVDDSGYGGSSCADGNLGGADAIAACSTSGPTTCAEGGSVTGGGCVEYCAGTTGGSGCVTMLTGGMTSGC